VGYAVDAQRRWAAICEARYDDDGNGRLEVMILHHGDTGGDQLAPYLVLGNGPGTPIDDFVAADPGGRWIVVTKDMCVHLVDAQSGKAVVLSGADGRPGDTVGGAHRAAHFSPDGKRLLYIRSNGDRANVVVRDLASGVEHVVDPGPGLLSAAYFDRSGRFVVMDVVVTDTDRDGRLRGPELVSTLSSRRCRGPVASASFFGEFGDRPVQRIAPVSGGKVENAPRGRRLEPIKRLSPSYELVGRTPALGLPETLLPVGPLRWQLRNYR
jgi:hypothetical protein